MLVSAGSKWERFINTPAHHTLHHLYFTCNYGQVSISLLRLLICQFIFILFAIFKYFTWADRYSGSYRPPCADLDPLFDVIALDGKSVPTASGVSKEGDEKQGLKIE
jgi:lathosterol oxidase